MITALVISTFVHGTATHRPGETAEFPRLTFDELAARGLVRENTSQPEPPPAKVVRVARTLSNKKAPEPVQATPSTPAASDASAEAAVLAAASAVPAPAPEPAAAPDAETPAPDA